MKLRIILGGLALAGLLLVGGARAADDKFEKPEDAFDAFVKAMKKNDLKKAHAALTPDSGDTLAFEVVFAAIVIKKVSLGLDKTGKAAKAFEPLDAALSKHGLKEDKLDESLKGLEKIKDDRKKIAAEIKKILAPVKDKGALLNDVAAALDKAAKDKKQKGKGVPDAKLTDVKIDGDKAAGTIKLEEGDKERSMKVKFEKVGGSWRMELPEEMFRPLPK